MDKRSPIFITSTGYDPEVGLHVKDPNLGGEQPTLGACRPDLRRKLKAGDYVFVISGKVPKLNQFIMGGFEVAEIITALDAYNRFPNLRLKHLPDGQIDGNIIVDAAGNQHMLDHHDSRTFAHRIENYVVGKNPIVMSAPTEIEKCRAKTMEFLSRIFGKSGDKPRDIIGRMSKMDAEQVRALLSMLEGLKIREIRIFSKGRMPTSKEDQISIAS
jgi:hypothetical protein